MAVIVAIRILGAAGTVTASGVSGLEAGSYIGGILAAGISGTALYFAIAGANRAKRKEYRDELEAAERRGGAAARQALEARLRNVLDELTEAREERDFYREKYFDVGGRQLPAPRRNPDQIPETD